MGFLSDDLKKVIKGDVSQDKDDIDSHSTDASLFKVIPEVVVYPKNAEDVKNLVRYVKEHKNKDNKFSLTARAAGSGMAGGSLNESVILDFTKYFNHFEIEDGVARVEPGVYYRDFEQATLERGLLMPSYPASKSLAALGGMIANNSGGEKTLRYGQTRRYVKELKVVLADAKEYTLKKLDKQELEKKKLQQDFEGDIYRRMYELLENNYNLVQSAKPNVSKNSAGYALWHVWNREYFDLTQLFAGSQGTLGLITEACLQLIKVKKHTRLAVLFLKDLDELSGIINSVLPLEPESLETFDNETLKLALRFFPSIAKKLEGETTFSLALKFLPEFFIGLRMLGFPKLIILVQFAEDSDKEAERKIQKLQEKLSSFKVKRRILQTAEEAEKYWIIRRESFNLLREHVKGKRAAPFVDDLIISPDKLAEVLPKIHKIFKEYGIHETIAGHAGSGNFHIIPLMDLTKKEEREKIPKISDKIYDIVLKYGGSITAEHNDGLIRSPYLEKMYGKEVYELFKEVKRIFDPDNIFNPGKKVGSSLEYAMEHINQES